MNLTFDDYQKFAEKTANYPEIGHNLIYPALGLIGEAGEVAEKVKKLWRNHGIKGGITVEDSPRALELTKEIGDVLWYAAALATELGIDLSEIAEQNIRKLADRQERGVIKSEGDNR